jgi:endonuclease/exonuclease/phosphatase family metal-dependent hydrolase
MTRPRAVVFSWCLLLCLWGCTDSRDLDGGWWTQDGWSGDGDAGPLDGDGGAAEDDAGPGDDDPGEVEDGADPQLEDGDGGQLEDGSDPQIEDGDDGQAEDGSDPQIEDGSDTADEDGDGGQGADGGCNPLDGDPADPVQVGSCATFELATWNLHNFSSDQAVSDRVEDLLRRLDLDVVVVEEIGDEATFRALVGRLPERDVVLSPHEYSPGNYQKVGLVVRRGQVQVLSTGTWGDDDSYAFPRPAFEVQLAVQRPDGGTWTFLVIALHLKAGVAADDALRRRDACEKLAARVDALLAAGTVDQVVLAGDLNDALDDPPADNVFQAFLDAPARYEPLTMAPYLEGTFSYISFHEMIDHLIPTDSWLVGLGAPRAVVVRLDLLDLGYDFEGDVSDHLPVAAILPW